VGTVHHFFGAVPVLFQRVTDPRAPHRIRYPLAALAWTGVLLFLFRLGARRQIGLLLRTEAAAATYATLFRVPAVPHGDTLDATLARVAPAELQEVVTGMTETLIRRKVLDPGRLLGRFFVIALDGTGTLTFHRRHCPHCLTRTHQGHTLYYHTVLEAKLVTPAGWCLSLMSEFIENPGEHPTKQDCELRAFYRLAARLKARFPRLPLLLSLDGLFACGPVFALCARAGWSYMIVLKDDVLRSVHEEVAGLGRLQGANRLTWCTGPGDGIQQQYRWVDGIAYVDSEKRVHTVTVIECRETRPPAGGSPVPTYTWKWVTNRPVTERTVVTLAQDGGRLRWKVENEGFNVQKNGGYGLEHGYSTQVMAGKNFYFLLQIAHLLAQLLEKGSLLRPTLATECGSAKNLAFRLLEAWRNAALTAAALAQILGTRRQIRFDSS